MSGVRASSMAGVDRDKSSDAAERRELARRHAAEARDLYRAGGLSKITDRIVARYPKVMERLAK